MTLAFHALALSEAPERLEEVRVLAQDIAAGAGLPVADSLTLVRDARVERERLLGQLAPPPVSSRVQLTQLAAPRMSPRKSNDTDLTSLSGPEREAVLSLIYRESNADSGVPDEAEPVARADLGGPGAAEITGGEP